MPLYCQSMSSLSIIMGLGSKTQCDVSLLLRKSTLLLPGCIDYWNSESHLLVCNLYIFPTHVQSLKSLDLERAVRGNAIWLILFLVTVSSTYLSWMLFSLPVFLPPASVLSNVLLNLHLFKVMCSSILISGPCIWTVYMPWYSGSHQVIDIVCHLLATLLSAMLQRIIKKSRCVEASQCPTFPSPTTFATLFSLYLLPKK